MKLQTIAVAALVALTTILMGCGDSGTKADAGIQDAAKTPAAHNPNAPETTTPVVVEDPSKPAAPEKKEAETLPAVVAKVGDEVVKGADFGWQLDFTKKRAQMQGMPTTLDDKKKRELLDEVIKEKVLLLLAKKAGVCVTDDELKAEVDKQKAHLGAHFAEMGLTDAQFQSMIKENLILRKFIDVKKKDIAVSDEEVKAQYEKYKADGKMDQPATTDVAHILIKVEGKDDAAWAAGKKKIDAARARIVGGEPFEKVAKEVSEDPGSKENGGKYPGTRKGQMVPEFDKAMEETPVGQVSQPFKTQYGWHILTVTAKNEAKTMSLDDVKDKLKDVMIQPKLKPMLEKLIADSRKDIKIEVFLPNAGPEASDVTKPEAAKVEETKAAEPVKADAPKTPEAAKADAPKTPEAAKADAPKTPETKPAAPQGAKKSK